MRLHVVLAAGPSSKSLPYHLAPVPVSGRQRFVPRTDKRDHLVWQNTTGGTMHISRRNNALKRAEPRIVRLLHGYCVVGACRLQACVVNALLRRRVTAPGSPIAHCDGGPRRILGLGRWASTGAARPAGLPLPCALISYGLLEQPLWISALADALGRLDLIVDDAACQATWYASIGPKTARPPARAPVDSREKGLLPRGDRGPSCAEPSAGLPSRGPSPAADRVPPWRSSALRSLLRVDSTRPEVFLSASSIYMDCNGFSCIEGVGQDRGGRASFSHIFLSR